MCSFLTGIMCRVCLKTKTCRAVAPQLSPSLPGVGALFGGGLSFDHACRVATMLDGLGVTGEDLELVQDQLPEYHWEWNEEDGFRPYPHSYRRRH